MTVVLLPSLIHQLLLLISIFPLLSKARSKKQFQGEKLQNEKERKYVFTKEIRSFFGGPTIVKSSSPHSKEKKLIKID